VLNRYPDDRPRKVPFWRREFTRRETIIAYGVTGWGGAFAMMAFGDYQLAHRWPTPLGLLGYALLALLFAPLFAWIGKWKSAGLRRLVRGGKDEDDATPPN
jgi:hypothetical protein